jgi:hypothetical protein
MRRIRSPCCARRQRPRDGCAAEQRDELTAVHSITSSARAMSVRGTSLHMSVLQCFQCLQSAAPAGWRSGSMCRHRYPRLSSRTQALDRKVGQDLGLGAAAAVYWTDG